MEGGGAERVAALLANGWASKGNNVVLMPTFSERGNCVYPLDPMVKLAFLSDLCPPRANRMRRLIRLRSFVKTFAPDVIVSFLPHVNIAAIIASGGLSIPVIACERTYPPALQPPISLAYRLLRVLTYPFASVLVAQTNATAGWLRRRSGRAPVVTIPNPVVLPLPSKPPILDPGKVVGPDRKIILWAGRLDTWKRGILLIEAFRRLASELCDWDIYMLGSGPIEKELQKRVHDLELGDRVFLPGFVGNLGDWYKRADLYVMTSSYEGFPNTLLEALAHGVPSIAFDVLTGPRDLCGDSNRLVLLPDIDHVAHLEEALKSLTSDSRLRSEMSAAAVEIKFDYSEQAILAKWDELFLRFNTSFTTSKTKLRAASTK